MKNLDFLKYLRGQEDAAYERIKLGHFDENGAAYYRGKHDQAFAMRRDLEERLRLDARLTNHNVALMVAMLRSVRKRTLTRKGRAWIDKVLALLTTYKEDEK